MSHRQISHYVGAYPTTFLPSAAEFMGLPNEFGVFQCIEADDPIYSVMRKSKPICNKGCLGSVHSVENRMIQVRNCFLKEKRTSYRTYVIGAPATLEIIRWRWKCEQCGNRFWDDYTPLLGMSKDTTIALRQYIGKSALQNSFEELSTRYKVSADVVKQCFNAEIEKRDAERLWKTPQVLALLTLTFRKESYCLCISADKAELLEMFLWSDVQTRNDFAKKIKNKKKIQKILVGTDKIVHEWAMKNFPSTPILVDKIRIVSLLETALDDVIYDKKNALSPEYNTLCKRRNWLQTASDKLCIRLHGNEVKEICQKFSDVDTSVQLKEKMSSMYTVPTGQEKVFDEWVQAVPHQIIPFYVLVDPFKELRKEIVDFAIARIIMLTVQTMKTPLKNQKQR